MSQENVEIVLQAFDAFGRGDVDGVLRLCDEDIVITQPSELLDASSLKQYGHRGVREAFALFPEQWNDFRVENVRVLADPADHVIVALGTSGRGKRSGVEVRMEFAFLFRVHEEKITEWRLFLQQAQALEAAGLSE